MCSPGYSIEARTLNDLTVPSNLSLKRWNTTIMEQLWNTIVNCYQIPLPWTYQTETGMNGLYCFMQNLSHCTWTGTGADTYCPSSGPGPCPCSSTGQSQCDCTIYWPRIPAGWRFPLRSVSLRTWRGTSSSVWFFCTWAAAWTSARRSRCVRSSGNKPAE